MNENMELNELKKAISTKLEKLITIKSTKDSNQEYKGYVLKFSDGVARVLGITKARIGQRLTFYSEIINENGEKKHILIDGMIMDIEPQWTECIVFGEERFIKEGQTVEIKTEDRNLPFTINYSDSYLGKVIDPLCNVQKIDNDTAEFEGVDDIKIHKLSIEVPAPLIANRAPVNKPLFTGIKVVDSVLPIGLGQRMLIIGDRGTGKSALAKTMMINYGVNGSVGIEKKGFYIYCYW
jgi:F0F1-type ATP synthase alpha subunit